MKSNRRNFLKLSGLTGIGIASSHIVKAFGSEDGNQSKTLLSKSDPRFNMCGYAAPKLETVRIGFIGLGNRGPGAVMRTSKIEGVEIKALCDIRPEKANGAKKKLLESTKAFNPEVYTGGENEWKKVCERPDIDLIYIATPWNLHTPMAVYAMQHGKHVATEVPAAVTVEECWQLVETSEKTRKHCMMLENCCYDFFELLTLNLARQDWFGEIVHCEGAYIHNLVDELFSKDYYYDMWRLKQNVRNGNLYPTHGLGPVAQVLNINRGDKMDSLESMSSDDFTLAAKAKELAAKDDFYKPFANKRYRGNMNTTTIRTNKGRTIMLQHDVSSPYVYSRIHIISCTKGSCIKYQSRERIAKGDEKWLNA
ncbi:MAG: Gfo/Idh/MocA family oxidoreductase, partial [Flavisolibacter sp.]|nr:Gfo/Idh/MocA family oxidoreductase [Flavisolibacter sp.]